MKQIPLTEAADGDVLGEDLMGPAGNLVLGKGTALSASMIARLEKVGVETIAITDGDAGDDAESRAKQVALVEERFQGCDDHPYLSEMKRIVLDHLSESV